MRAVLGVLGMTVLATLAATPARARSLRDQLPEAARLTGIEDIGAFDALADAIADTAARNLPVVAASAGFTYRYNPELEIFERTSETLGPLLLERPDTLGRGKLNVNVTYQYVELNEIDGVDTDELQDPNPIVVSRSAAGGPLGPTANDLRYNFKLINHVVGVSLTYGILDALDLNLLVPIIVTDFDVTANNRQRFEAAVDGPFFPQPRAIAPGVADGEHTGLGDILLRAKYQLPRLAGWRSAAGLQLRLPSGDEDEFSGTGSFEASPFFYLSTVLWSRVEPHANLGIDLRADDVERSQGRYGVGVDVDVTRRFGVALAFLGRSEFERSSEAGETSFQHLVNPGNATSQNGRCVTGCALRPLLGIEFDRKDYFDLSFGARAVVWRQLMLFVNGIYALNDDGLRNDSVIPMVGLEGTF